MNGQVKFIISQKHSSQQPESQEGALIERAFKSFTGLDQVKNALKSIAAWSVINQKRAEFGLKTHIQTHHMLFYGNPGTGKTTAARVMAKCLKDLKIIEKGHLVEAERADLVGEYIGHTALKTRELIRKAQGGVLFIDEAYSLSRGGEKDFGREAIDTLVKHMEDQNEQFICVLAGYKKEMTGFLKMNTGLKSRFSHILYFPDYRLNELNRIANSMFSERDYQMSKIANERLVQLIREQDSSGGNARFVRNLTECIIRAQAVRLLKYESLTKKDCMLITEEDVIEGMAEYKKNKQEI
ncbi:stage V sporulation protein K [Jeotgalibacillus alimentarius]|uniref:Stage V sporulation protein K n=1 Tax=Jeotgalibacillus alimentarius TaxID=135826 RepID=A0A0C2W3D0_9BACL|nr:AAA family ATPase [Jeotgalibacillus alimentarius]KIL50563.1 stage V sporulation protein K [Jeotgalibacillus alimentarius]